MALSLGQLILDLKLNPTDYNRTLEKARTDALRVGGMIERSLGRGYTAKVDDSRLTALNRHLTSKEQHWGRVQTLMDTRPLTPKVNDQGLTNLNKQLDRLQNRNVQVNVKATATQAQPVQQAQQTQQVRVKTDSDGVSNAISKAIEKGFAAAKPKGNLLTGLITAPFKAIGAMFGPIVAGVGMGLGQNIAHDLGKGLSDGIQGELSDIIGSFNLVGRKLGQGLAEELLNAMGADLAGITQVINDVVGEADIAREGFATRGKQAAQAKKRDSYAGEQAREENKQFKQNYDRLQQQQSQLETERDRIQSQAQALQSKMEAETERLGAGRVRDRMADNQKSREALMPDLQAAAATGDQEGVNRISGRIKNLSDSYSDLSSELKGIYRTAETNLSKDSAALQQSIDDFYRANRSFQRSTAIEHNKDLLKIPADVASRSGRTVQAARVQGTYEFDNVAGIYEQIALDVAKASKVAMTSADIPRLVADDQMPKTANASYSPATNEIRIRPEVVEQISKGKLGDKEFETLVHELRHAMQALFGELTQGTETGVELLQATAEEAKKLGGRIEGSVKANVGGNSSYNRAVETDAYVFAERNTAAIKAGVEQKQAIARFNTMAGVGGGEIRNQYNEAQLKILQSLKGKIAGATVNVDDEISAMLAEIEGINKEFSRSFDAIPDIGQLPVAEIDQEIGKLQTAFKGAIADLFQLYEDFGQAVSEKPDRLRQTAREAAGTFNRKKELLPIAQNLGVEGAGQLNKKQLIDAIGNYPDVDRMSQEVFAVSRRRAAEQLQRQEAAARRREQLQEAAAGAGVVAGRVAGAGQSVFRKVAEYANSQQSSALAMRSNEATNGLIKAGAGVAHALGTAARAGLALAKGLEGVALDIMPMGRTIKGGLQQLALPAVGFTLATHALGPAGGAMAQGLHGLVGAGLDPLMQAGTSGLANSAAGFIGQAFPHAMGIAQGVSTATTGAIHAAGGAIGDMAVNAGTVVLGGKMLQAGAGAAVSAVGNAVDFKPKLALPPQAEPILVEAQQPLKALTATVSSNAISSPAAAVKQIQADQIKVEQATFAYKVSADDAVARAKEISAQIREGYQGLKAAIKKGDLQLADALIRTIQSMAETATAEISELSASLGADAKMGTRAGNQINNTKSQISRAKNLATQARLKVPEQQYAFEDRRQQIADLMQSLRDPATLRRMLPDAAAIAGGTLASTAAGAAGPVAGSVAGVVGSMAARQTSLAGAAGVTAYQKLQNDQVYQSATLLQKFNALLKQAAVELQALESEMGNGLTGDVTGSAIAMAVDQILNSISPVLAAVPGKGAAAAAAIAPRVVEARQQFSSEARQYSSAGLQQQVDQVLAEFSGLDSAAQDVQFAFGGIDEAISSTINRIRELNAKPDPEAEAKAYQAEDRFGESYNRFQRAESNINQRFDQSVRLPDLEQPEAIAARIKRLVSSGGFIDMAKERIQSMIGTFMKIPGAFGLAMSSLLGLGGAAVIIPILQQIGEACKQAALDMDRFSRTINFTSGGASRGAEVMASLRSEAKRLGTDLRASVEGYAQFSASTKDTSLEGDQSLSIFKNVSQATANYQLSPERQQLVFGALSQLASKGVVSMEELRQQLGDSLPGALNIAARSMGMTTSEFSKMVERGEVLSSEFLPKFAQQLGAESSVGVAASSKSAQASLNRLNNVIFELQSTMGQFILQLNKIGADVAVGGIEVLIGVLTILMKMLPAIALLFAGKFLASFAAAGAIIPTLSKALGSLMAMIAKFAPIVGAFLAKFLIVQTIIDTLGMVGKALSDQGGQFREFATAARTGLKDYEIALIAAGIAQRDFLDSMPKNASGLKGDSLLQDSFLGGVAGFVGGDRAKQAIGDFERGAQGLMGGRTFAQNQADDRSIAMDDLAGSRMEMRYRVAQQLKGAQSELNQVKDIDRQIQEIQGRRRGLAVTAPNDKEGARALKSQEDALLGKREALVRPVAALQQANAAEIETYKAAIKSLGDLAQSGKITQDEYNVRLVQFQTALAGAQKDQEALTQAMASSVNGLAAFERAWAGIVDKLEDATSALEKTGNATRKAIAESELAGGSQGESARRTELLQQDQLAEKIKLNRQAIAQMRSEMNVQDVGTIRKNYNITDQTGAAELKTLSDRATGPRDKALLAKLADLQQLEGQVVGFEADLAEAQVSAMRRMRDLAKQVEEFYQGIQRQAQEAALSSKEIRNQIANANAKNRLKSALKGFQDNYISEFVDSLIGLIDSLSQPFEQAIAAQREIMGKQQQLQDTLKQATELGGQLPTGSEVVANPQQQQSQQAAGAVAGILRSGLYSGPSHRIGGSAEYHIDTKVSRDVSWPKVVEMFDKMAAGYRAQGREIEFSNAAVAGARYNELADYKAREALLKRAFAAHHSQGRDINNGVRSVDYYIPKRGRGRYDKSAEGAEVLLPAIPGAKLDYASGGGYGNYVNIYDKSGKYLMSTGHGDNARTLPQDRVVSGAAVATVSRPALPKSPAGGGAPMGVTKNLPSTLTPEGRKMAAYLNNPNVTAFLAAVARAEGLEGKPGGGYNLGFGYRKINDLSKHPYDGRELTPGGVSSASGRYQFMGHTWKEQRQQLGLPDFSPQSQEIAAIALLKRRGVLGQVAAGKVDTGTLRSIAPEWASVEYEGGRGYYPGQLTPEGRHGSFMSYYNKARKGARMAPTTAYTNAEINRRESAADAGAALQGRLGDAAGMATQTSRQEIADIEARARAMGAGARLDAARAARKAERQLQTAGRDQSRSTRDLLEQFGDMRSQIGESTPDKQFQQELTQAEREYRNFRERVADESEKVKSTLAEALSVRDVLKKGDGLPEELKRFVPELDKQITLLQEQDAKLNTLSGNIDDDALKKLADIRQKYEQANAARRFAFEQELGGKQIEVLRAEVQQAQTQAQRPGTTRDQRFALQQKALDLGFQADQKNVQNQMAQFNMALDEQVRKRERTKDEAAALRAEYERLAKIDLSNLQSQLEAQTEELRKAQAEMKWQEDSKVFESRMSINDAKGNYARTMGFEYQANQYEKEGAIARENYSLQQGMREIDQWAKDVKAAPDIVAQLRNNLTELNAVNLQNINAQFNPMTEALKGVKGAFQGFLGDVITGNESIEDAFSKMIDNVLNSLANLAAQLITEQLFGSLFGMGGGGGGGLFGGGGGGGIGGLLGGLFGFAEGGIVPGHPGHQRLRDRPDEIGYALRREGPNAVLATLTPGEMVLTRAQTRNYLAMQSRAGYAIGAAQKGDRIQRFSEGGIVRGGNFPIAIPSGGSMGGTSVSVPIQINAGSSQEKPSINMPKLRDAVRASVLEELRRQQRPNGRLDR
jgi:tape measure domain-containing protein